MEPRLQISQVGLQLGPDPSNFGPNLSQSGLKFGFKLGHVASQVRLDSGDIGLGGHVVAHRGTYRSYDGFGQSFLGSRCG